MLERVVYFYLMDGTHLLGRKKTDPAWLKKEKNGLEILYCGIPEYYKKPFFGKRAIWTTDIFQQFIEEECRSVYGSHYYISEEWKERLKPETANFIISSELLNCFMGKYRGVTQLLLIDGMKGEIQSDNFYEEVFTATEIHPLLCGLRGMWILTEREEAFAGLEIWMWEEYGIPIQFCHSEMAVKNMMGRGEKGKILIIDLDSSFQIKKGPLLNLTAKNECIYVDACSIDEKKREFAGKGRRLHYVSEKQYLDRTFLTLGGKIGIIR